MSYAAARNYHNNEVLGCFVERSYKNTFEFGVRDEEWRKSFAPEFDKVIYCGPNSEPRAAQIGKTIARVVTDEDASGNPIVCVWRIRSLRNYK